MIHITIDDRELLATLERLGRRLGNLTPIMRGIATELEARVEERFERQRDPAGRAWAPLAARTVARKKRGAAILYDSGDLQGSLTSAAGRDWAQVGFGQPYAAYHEWGTRDMPRRGLLMDDPARGTLGEGDRQAVLEMLAEQIDLALR